MNTQSPRSPRFPRPTTVVQTAPAAPRREYRERDFGVGYGRSSGYASARRYVAPWNGQPHFRCV
jgi:hypothetical protein